MTLSLSHCPPAISQTPPRVGPQVLPGPHCRPVPQQAWSGCLARWGAAQPYLQVALGDGLLLHPELQVLHLPAGGERGLTRLRPGEGCLQPGIQGQTVEGPSDRSRAPWKPPGLPASPHPCTLSRTLLPPQPAEGGPGQWTINRVTATLVRTLQGADAATWTNL